MTFIADFITWFGRNKKTKVYELVLLTMFLGFNLLDETAKGQQSSFTDEASSSTIVTTPVPGTSVSIPIPDGFVSTDRFSGFIKESTNSSIFVVEMPGPYSQVTAGFTNKNEMLSKGMKLIDHKPVKVDGHKAVLLNVEQNAYGKVFNKWILAAEQSNTTVLIVASFPKAETVQGDALREAILRTEIGKQSDPEKALTFTVSPVEPMKIAKVMGQIMVLSPDGKYPPLEKDAPVMVIALSMSEGLKIDEKETFAEMRILKTATVKDIHINQTTPITIGKLSGYATTANGVREKRETALTIYQVILFDDSGYFLIQGITPSATKDTNVPMFKKIAETFKMKDN